MTILKLSVILGLTVGCSQAQFKGEKPTAVRSPATTNSEPQAKAPTKKDSPSRPVNSNPESKTPAPKPEDQTPGETPAGEQPAPLPSSPENFCLGFQNIDEAERVAIAQEVEILCPDGKPSATFINALNTPYNGEQDPATQTLLNQEDEAKQESNLTLIYTIRLDRKPTDILKLEENAVSVPYNGGNLLINAGFLAPPQNKGSAFTAFNLEQSTVVDDNVSFNDTSKHSLKMYQLHKNNFSMFLTARTLQAETEQFKNATIVRGIFAAPNNPNQSLSVSILNFKMNSREQHDRLIEAFMGFVESTMVTIVDLSKN